ncbi:iron complex transport system ATP-binding protein [Donghicola eburneus]|nr:iron complex transport system ATP-binding protein [Donghicola eburneus]
MPVEPALSLDNVAVNVAGKAYVRNVSLTVPKGEVHGLLGPNGAGKTTLLRCLYRAADVTSGRVHAQGKEITDYTHQEWAKTVGALVQSSGLLAGLTPRDIVEIGLSVLDLPAHEYATRCDEALSLVGLADKQHQSAGALSGGELQRCYFAQLLACDPDIYVLDEPTNHLDLHYQLVLLDEVKRRGRTVLMTIHDLNLAARYCDRVYLMSEGEILAQGAALDVLTRDNLIKHYAVDGQFVGKALELAGPILGQLDQLETD